MNENMQSALLQIVRELAEFRDGEHVLELAMRAKRFLDLNGYTYGKCDACGHLNDSQGLCTRSGCVNSD